MQEFINITYKWISQMQYGSLYNFKWKNKNTIIIGLVLLSLLWTLRLWGLQSYTKELSAGWTATQPKAEMMNA